MKQPESDQEKEKLSVDEAAAIAPLKKIDALSALLALDAGRDRRRQRGRASGR